MEGHAIPICQFISQCNLAIIPIYQRRYDWKKENCKQLLDDILAVYRGERESHFVGSIVAQSCATQMNTYTIIDGQQRLTTFSLLCLAIANVAEKNGYKGQNSRSSFKQNVENQYLINPNLSETEKEFVRLQLINEDQRVWLNLLQLGGVNNEKSNIYANYQYFYDALNKLENLEFEELFKVVSCKLIVVRILLDLKDDAQLIFESLNSTGLDLKEGDKIRNFILMKLPQEIQKSYYIKYWHPIENETQLANDGNELMLSEFIRDFLTLKTIQPAKVNHVYEIFKERYKKEIHDSGLLENLLIELLDYAKCYHWLLSGEGPNNTISLCIQRINELEAVVVRPFFLEVLYLYLHKKINDVDVVELFELSESYIIRGVICGNISAGQNKLFAALSKMIYNINGNYDNFVNKFKRLMINRKDKNSFPDDTTFIECLRRFDAFHSKRIQFMLERFECFDTRETLHAKIFKELTTKGKPRYSIEHIMPQNIEKSDEWKMALGENWKTIHDDWCHRLANLTITAYNSQYSNKPFVYKRDMENGLSKSGVRMNQYISSFEHWSLSELEQRNKHLSNQALQLWPYPQTDYELPVIERQHYTINDDPNIFKNRKLLRAEFMDTRLTAKSWSEMFCNVLEFLLLDDKYHDIIINLAQKKGTGINTIQTQSSENLRKFNTQIGNSEIYLWTTSDTKTKLHWFQQIFEICKIPANLLKFWLVEETGK